MRYKGKKVLAKNGYPIVYWPDHPLSYGDGTVYVHRAVAHEQYGQDTEDNHVHHKDGDVWNWSPENLEILTPSEHASLHNPMGWTPVECDNCGVKFSRRSADLRHENTYCSRGCVRKDREKIEWPPVSELQRRADNIGFSALGRELGVSDNAIRKRIKNYTPVPPRSYMS